MCYVFPTTVFGFLVFVWTIVMHLCSFCNSRSMNSQMMMMMMMIFMLKNPLRGIPVYERCRHRERAQPSPINCDAILLRMALPWSRFSKSLRL